MRFFFIFRYNKKIITITILISGSKYRWRFRICSDFGHIEKRLGRYKTPIRISRYIEICFGVKPVAKHVPWDISTGPIDNGYYYNDGKIRFSKFAFHGASMSFIVTNKKKKKMQNGEKNNKKIILSNSR